MDTVSDTAVEQLKALQAHINAPENVTVDTPAPEKSMLSRKLCKSKPLTFYKLQPGAQFTLTPAEVKSGVLTSALIATYYNRCHRFLRLTFSFRHLRGVFIVRCFWVVRAFLLKLRTKRCAR